jgi:hypothetical protein
LPQADFDSNPWSLKPKIEICGVDLAQIQIPIQIPVNVDELAASENLVSFL